MKNLMEQKQTQRKEQPRFHSLNRQDASALTITEAKDKKMVQSKLLLQVACLTVLTHTSCCQLTQKRNSSKKYMLL